LNSNTWLGRSYHHAPSLPRVVLLGVRLSHFLRILLFCLLSFLRLDRLLRRTLPPRAKLLHSLATIRCLGKLLVVVPPPTSRQLSTHARQEKIPRRLSRLPFRQ